MLSPTVLRWQSACGIAFVVWASRGHFRRFKRHTNRTLLGQNLSSECLVARFLAPEGEIDELLEIDG